MPTQNNTRKYRWTNKVVHDPGEKAILNLRDGRRLVVQVEQVRTTGEYRVKLRCIEDSMGSWRGLEVGPGYVTLIREPVRIHPGSVEDLYALGRYFLLNAGYIKLDPTYVGDR